MCITIILLYCLIFKNLNSKLHFGDKPTWSWFWKLVVSISEVLHSIFIRDIALCFLFNTFVWFWYQGNPGLIKLVVKCSFSSVFWKSLYRIDAASFLNG